MKTWRIEGRAANGPYRLTVLAPDYTAACYKAPPGWRIETVVLIADSGSVQCPHGGAERKRQMP